MSISDVKMTVLKTKNSLRPHLLAVLVEIVVGGPFLLLTPDEEEEEDFFFLFLCVALATASLCGKIIPDVGVVTTMLVSVLQVAAFLNLFFGGLLK